MKVHPKPAFYILFILALTSFNACQGSEAKEADANSPCELKCDREIYAVCGETECDEEVLTEECVDNWLGSYCIALSGYYHCPGDRRYEFYYAEGPERREVEDLGVCVFSADEEDGDVEPAGCQDDGECLSGMYCNVESGQCGECRSGETRCIDSQLSTCDDQGDWAPPVDCLATPRPQQCETAGCP
jgi:hypothetical protein